MANKPDKFGMKFWLAVDVKFKYIPNIIPYLGKDKARLTTQKLSENVIIKKMKPYLGKEKSVSTDNFFILTHLDTQL